MFQEVVLVMGQVWFLDLLSNMVYFTYPNVHFVAGEARVSTLSPLVYAAVVTEGAALGTRDSLVLGVLQNIMGTGPSVKYGSGAAGSRLIQAAGGATSQPFAVCNTRIFWGICIVLYVYWLIKQQSPKVWLVLIIILIISFIHYTFFRQFLAKLKRKDNNENNKLLGIFPPIWKSYSVVI